MSSINLASGFGKPPVTAQCTTYVFAMIQIFEKEKKGKFMNSFNSELPGMLSETPAVQAINGTELDGEISCDMWQPVTQPEASQNSIGYIYGQFHDKKISNGFAPRVYALQWHELPGDPCEDDFLAPSDKPAVFNCVGRVIPSVKGGFPLPPGFRHFDVQTSCYDPIEKSHEEFSLQWIYTDAVQYAKFKVPQPGCIVQMTGPMVGRFNGSRRPNENYICCFIENIHFIFWAEAPSSYPKQNQQVPSQTGLNSESNLASSQVSFRKRRRQLTMQAAASQHVQDHSQVQGTDLNQPDPEYALTQSSDVGLSSQTMEVNVANTPTARQTRSQKF